MHKMSGSVTPMQLVFEDDRALIATLHGLQKVSVKPEGEAVYKIIKLRNLV